MRKSTVSHFAILKGWYFIISFAKKSANDHNKPKYGGKGKRQNQVEYLKSFDVNVWRGWYSWQDGECRARKGGINGYSLRHGRRLFSFQHRNRPSLSQKLFDILKNFIKLNTYWHVYWHPGSRQLCSTSSPSHHDLSDLSDLRVTPDVAWDSLWHVFTGRP